MLELQFRAAALEDSSFLLSIRNSEDVRLFSTNQSKIDELEHQEWLDRRILNIEKNPFWIVSLGGVSVGYLRFDQSENESTFISIGVKDGLRGKGLGKEILNIGVGLFRKLQPSMEIKATIHKNNKPSLVIFASLGFVEVGNQEDFVIFQYQR